MNEIEIVCLSLDRQILEMEQSVTESAVENAILEHWKTLHGIRNLTPKTEKRRGFSEN